MTITLTEDEARVIGVLLEKSVTTPEQYPLSLNALINGCNQKSNRFPVTQYSEDDVTNIIEGLKAKRLIQTETGFGSRVAKYTHRFCNTEFGDITLSDHQQAIVTELLLRGAQTAGELRGRCQRLTTFTDMSDVEAAINSLVAFQPDSLVEALPREAGKREVRYRQKFTQHTNGASPETASPSEPQNNHDTLARLRQDVLHMKTTLAQLESRIEAMENHQP